ncbi:hypothetical protein [Aestuariimicrobium sp. Y1814]|uniref:hypothetical protein n=1 Tax=Aestuariimicrobium sp. Y1814 TaxID=3418742 RepID=UPI003DA7493C
MSLHHPGPPQQAPQYPGAPYAGAAQGPGPGSAQKWAGPRPQPADRSKGVGTAALVLAAIVTVAQVFLQVLLVATAYSGRPVALLGGVWGILVMLLTLAALVLGILALVQPGGRKARAGIAVGVSGYVLLTALTNIVVGMMYS